MSQKPASARPVPPPTRVSNGIPWWLWLVIGGFGVFIGATLIRKAIPEDPALLVQEGFDALDKGDAAAVERSVQKLKQFPEYAAEQKLIEGMMYLGKSKPLLAVPLLREAANEPKIRLKALTQLGSALTRSRQRKEAIEVFETVVKEDESADEARLNLAYLFKDMISWDTAIQHLVVLKEHGHQLGTVHQMLAEIYFEKGKFADAATEYKAAIEADPTSPTNSQKASRFISSKIEAGDLEGIEEFATTVDAVGIRASAQALVLANKGETDEALSALDHVLHEVPNDVTANLAYAQIMAGLDSKERAIEALTSLREPASYLTRSLKMFEFVAKLGTIAERPELAVTAKQNADQLRDLESQFASKLSEVVKTRNDARSRIELGDLARAAGHLETARSMYLGASHIDMSLEPELEGKIMSLLQPLPLLVPMDNSSNEGGTETPAAEPAPETGTSPDASPKEEPKDALKEEAASEATPETKAETPSEPKADAPSEPTPETTPEPTPK